MLIRDSKSFYFLLILLALDKLVYFCLVSEVYFKICYKLVLNGVAR